MTLFRTVAPAVEPVTTADAKAELRIDHDTEDTLLAGLIRAAREEVEAATAGALVVQSWRLALDRWPRDGIVLLRRNPVREILAVTVYGDEGEASLIDPATYTLDAERQPARLHLADRPAPKRIFNGIEIDFSAGFGETGADVPDLLKRAILKLVAHWYEFRAGFGADDQPVSLPDGYRRLVAAYRRPRIG